MENQNKLIKKELAKKFGYKNIKVIGGRGTAYGWVEIGISIEKPKNCLCKEGETYCSECKKALNKTDEEAKKLIYAIPGIKFYTYLSDDGYGTDRDCVLIQVSVKK